MKIFQRLKIVLLSVSIASLSACSSKQVACGDEDTLGVAHLALENLLIPSDIKNINKILKSSENLENAKISIPEPTMDFVFSPYEVKFSEISVTAKNNDTGKISCIGKFQMKSFTFLKFMEELQSKYFNEDADKDDGFLASINIIKYSFAMRAETQAEQVFPVSYDAQLTEDKKSLIVSNIRIPANAIQDFHTVASLAYPMKIAVMKRPPKNTSSRTQENVATAQPGTAAPSTESTVTASANTVSAKNDWNPSFSCKPPLNTAETLICASKELSELDVSLAEIYDVVGKSTSDIQGLRDTQREWRLNERDKCSDSSCVTKAYKVRIQALRALH